MFSNFENQSTSLYSIDFELLNSSKWKAAELLNQNFSKSFSFTKQENSNMEGLDKYDNDMNEQSLTQQLNDVFRRLPNLFDEEKDNYSLNEKNLPNVGQNDNNLNDNLTSEMPCPLNRKREREEKKPKKRGTHDYYIKSFLSDLLNNFVRRELKDRIKELKKCQFITIKKDAKIKKCNYITNIGKQIERTLKVFVEEKTVEEIFYTTNKELFDNIKKECKNFQNPAAEEFLNYINRIMENVIKDYYHSKEFEDFKNKVFKKTKRTIKDYDNDFIKERGRGYSLLEPYNFIEYARSKPYSQKPRKKSENKEKRRKGRKKRRAEERGK